MTTWRNKEELSLANPATGRSITRLLEQPRSQQHAARCVTRPTTKTVERGGAESDDRSSSASGSSPWEPRVNEVEGRERFVAGFTNWSDSSSDRKASKTGNAISFGFAMSRRGVVSTRAARRLLLDKDRLPATGSRQTSLPDSWITGFYPGFDWWTTRKMKWSTGGKVETLSTVVTHGSEWPRVIDDRVDNSLEGWKVFQDWEQVDRSETGSARTGVLPYFSRLGQSRFSWTRQARVSTGLPDDQPG